MCPINSKCENNEGSFECFCDSGFIKVENDDGTDVCNDIDECTNGSVVCHVSTNCKNTSGSYACDCDDGFGVDGDDDD